MRINDFKLERYFERYEFDTPYLLCTSDCETFRVEQLLELEPGYTEKLLQLGLGYTEPQGAPELREAVCTLYEGTGPEDVIVFSGAEEGIFIFMNVLLEPGDSIIVTTPCYQSLQEVARSVGSKVIPWPLDPDNGWRPDLDFLKDSIDETTRAIVINSPHSPTGYHMPRSELEAVVQLARQQGIYLFSDEVYRFLEYDKELRLPAVCDMYEKGVSLGVMSKAFGLAGLRIGWIGTGDRDLMKKIAAYKDYTTICNSAPSEFLASLALRHKDHLLWRNMEIIKSNLRLLDQFFLTHGGRVEWVKPRAGTIAFPRLKGDGAGTAESLGLDLIDKKGVLLLPGNLYDDALGSHFRIGYGRGNMPEALERFGQYLEEK